MIAAAFIPNPENKSEVNHINGVKSDNRIENLEWCTHKENMSHAKKIGLMSHKPSYGNRKLTNKEVNEIRCNNSETGIELSDKYGVSPSTISGIRLGKFWKNLSIKQKK